MATKNKTPSPYTELTNLSTTAAHYHGIGMLLEWDQEIYMPKKAIDVRSSQLELMASLSHQTKTGKPFAKALEKLIDLETGSILDSTLTPKQQAAVREWRRDFRQAVKLPLSFVEECAKVTSASMFAWAHAKEKNDFSLFLPHLEKIVALCRKKADFLGYSHHSYDPLIDAFEPGMTTHRLTLLFERLKTPLTTLVRAIQTKKQPKEDFISRECSRDKQISFGKKILSAMGFDKSFSRLDESVHPMCVGIHQTDIRMTTRIYPNNLISNIFSCLHEGGHGLYHAQLPQEEYGTPLGETASLAIDESQSRMWETLIGRSLPFWKHFFPLLQQEFPEALADINLEQFHKAINGVSPTLIRIESDEVTYNLHILVRFELEKALLEGSLAAKAIPEAWNEKMREYLGICPSADSEGCLQDIHWSMGAIGYFPTYTLGNLYAAQIFETFSEKHPTWKEQVAAGNLSFIREWLKNEIHLFGRQYAPEDLCVKVTGKPLSEKPFIHYLEKKYTGLYHL